MYLSSTLAALLLEAQQRLDMPPRLNNEVHGCLGRVRWEGLRVISKVLLISAADCASLRSTLPIYTLHKDVCRDKPRLSARRPSSFRSIAPLPFLAFFCLSHRKAFQFGEPFAPRLLSSRRAPAHHHCHPHLRLPPQPATVCLAYLPWPAAFSAVVRSVQSPSSVRGRFHEGIGLETTRYEPVCLPSSAAVARARPALWASIASLFRGDASPSRGDFREES